VNEPILDDIRELCKIFLPFNIGFARREANEAANNTAKFGCLQGESFSWDAELG
jgi:hypothetical protein